MWVRNTSSYPDDEVRELIEFATKGVNMTKVCVNVKGSSSLWAGRAYGWVPAVSNAPPTAEYLISLRIGKAGPNSYPTELRNYNGDRPDQVGPGNRFPFYQCNNWREALVHLAAHEARHVHQFRHRKSISEVDCERFAVKALERYRVRCAEREEAVA